MKWLVLAQRSVIASVVQVRDSLPTSRFSEFLRSLDWWASHPLGRKHVACSERVGFSKSNSSKHTTRKRRAVECLK